MELKCLKATLSSALQKFTLLTALLDASPTIHADVLYVSNNTSSTIETFDSATGLRLGVFASTGLMYPYGLALDRGSNLYVANGGGWIQRFDSTGFGWAVSYLANGPLGLAFDEADNLYVSEWLGNTIKKILPENSTFASGLNGPSDLVFSETGDLYVANYHSGTIMRITPNGIGSTFASDLNGPMGLAFDGVGNLYVSLCGDNTIEKFTPEGARSVFATGMNVPAGLAFDGAGNLYTANFGGNTIEKITSGGARSTFATDLSGPAYIVIQVVPEPSTWLFMGLALPLMVLFRRSADVAPQCGFTHPINHLSGTAFVLPHGRRHSAGVRPSSGAAMNEHP